MNLLRTQLTAWLALLLFALALPLSAALRAPHDLAQSPALRGTAWTVGSRLFTCAVRMADQQPAVGDDRLQDPIEITTTHGLLPGEERPGRQVPDGRMARSVYGGGYGDYAASVRPSNAHTAQIGQFNQLTAGMPSYAVMDFGAQYFGSQDANSSLRREEARSQQWSEQAHRIAEPLSMSFIPGVMQLANAYELGYNSYNGNTSSAIANMAGMLPIGLGRAGGAMRAGGNAARFEVSTLARSSAAYADDFARVGYRTEISVGNNFATRNVITDPARLLPAGRQTMGLLPPGRQPVGLLGQGATESSNVLIFPNERAVQKFFTKAGHGEDLGLKGNWNPSQASTTRSAINQFINSPKIKTIQGKYRGNSVTHYVDTNTGFNVMSDTSGNFVGGWKLGAEQLESVLNSGRLW